MIKETYNKSQMGARHTDAPATFIRPALGTHKTQRRRFLARHVPSTRCIRYPMRGSNISIATAFALVFLCLVVWCSPAAAISIKEEQQLAREFMKFLNRSSKIIDDPIIVDYVNRIGRRILATLPPQPFDYHFYVINEDVYNAFAIPAGHIFINSGLLMAMESEEELAGILSHEISHVVCRHISQRIEHSKKVNMVSLAGAVAGILLGAAAGEAGAAQALSMGSLAAGQSMALSFSRENETQADEIGLGYLEAAGYSAEGLLTMLQKIRSKQWFGSNQVPTYLMTHPAVEERIISIGTRMATQTATESDKIAMKHDSSELRRINIRLRALYTDPDAAVTYFQHTMAQNPSDAEMAYGYGLVLARKGHYTDAVPHIQRALASNALDPVILSDLGRLYFLSGRYEEALNVLEGAVSLPGNAPEGWFYLGRTYMALGQSPQAIKAFNTLLQTHRNYRQAYYFLGQTYDKLGRAGEAHYYLGIFHFKKGEFSTARHHFNLAQKSLQDPAKLETIREVLEKMRPSEQEQQSSQK